jgi:hypothetical protein
MKHHPSLLLVLYHLLPDFGYRLSVMPVSKWRLTLRPRALVLNEPTLHPATESIRQEQVRHILSATNVVRPYCARTGTIQLLFVASKWKNN